MGIMYCPASSIFGAARGMTLHISTRMICIHGCTYRYMLALKSAAAQIRASLDRQGLAVVLNVGPTWVKSTADPHKGHEVASLFANNVVEFTYKGDWEMPPGLGICQLSVIFEACNSISSWIAMDEDNVVVSDSTGMYCNSGRLPQKASMHLKQALKCANFPSCP